MLNAHYSKPLLLAVLLCSTLPQATASTAWWLGTILRVETKDGKGVLHVLQDLHNYNGEQDLTIKEWKINPKWFVYLDGKQSSAAEAFKPGRSIAIFSDYLKKDPAGGKKIKGDAALVSTTPGSGQVVPLNDPNCSMFMIELDRPGRLNNLCDGTPYPDKKSTVESIRAKWASLKIRPRLILEHASGHLKQGFAFTPSRHNHYPRWHKMDISKLQVQAGVVSGTATVDYTSTAGKSITATYDLNSAADGSGSFTGSYNGEEVSGKLKVTGMSSTRPENDFRLFLRCEDDRLRRRHWGFFNVAFTDNASATEGHLCFRKGKIVATATNVQLKRSDGQISGSFTVEDGKMSLEARLVDGRLVIGHIHAGEGDSAYSVAVSGWILLPNSPPTIHPKGD